MTFRRYPDTVTFLPTYDCTAACDNCCFGSHSGITQRLPLDRLLHHVDQVAALGSVKLVVFSGGECFKLGDDLVATVAHCRRRGLLTRCVSNAYWARSEAEAVERLRPLKEAGLGELNVSTGDEHQRFVPVNNVVNAIRAATTVGIPALVVVESQQERTFTAAALRSDPRWAELIERRTAPIVFESPWMSMDPENPVAQYEGKNVSAGNLHRKGGCDSVLRTLVVTPDERLGACCGLTREQIPELTVGSLRGTEMATLVDSMFDDFVKIWVAVDGPDHILAWVAERDPSVQWQGRFAHHCDSCRFMYGDPAVRKVITEHWEEVADDVLYRFAAITAEPPPSPIAKAHTT